MNLAKIKKCDELDPREAGEEQRGKQVEDLFKVPLFADELTST